MFKRNPILSVTAAISVLLMATVVGVFGQQTSGQQNCLNKLNKDGSGVAKAQGKENNGCLKGAGKGTLVGSAQTCLTADAKGKVQKAKSKTTADETANCAPPPSFGYTSASTVNAQAQQREVDLMADVFGANMDPAVIDCNSNKAGCKCQEKVLGDLEKLVDTKLKTFVNCKKAALKAGANSILALNDCINDGGTSGSIAADTQGKIAKGVTKLGTDIGKACDTPGVTTGAFPGKCPTQTGTALATCLDEQAECRVCQALNDMDATFANCDLFDNGVADASCDSGIHPTPTPTPSLTPTPTVTATCAPGPVVVGALVPTLGRFNYNAAIGLPAAAAACNTNFPGSHVCTYFELQCGQAAGSLVGLKDTSNNAVNGFWAVDPARPLLAQCVDDAGSNLRWEYGTGHTASRGDKVALNNGTGMLGALQMNQQCALFGTVSNVGCCQ